MLYASPNSITNYYRFGAARTCTLVWDLEFVWPNVTNTAHRVAALATGHWGAEVGQKTGEALSRSEPAVAGLLVESSLRLIARMRYDGVMVSIRAL